MSYFENSLTMAGLICIVIALAAILVAARRHHHGQDWGFALGTLIRPAGLAMSVAVIVAMTVYTPYVGEVLDGWRLEGGRYFNGNFVPLRTIRSYLASTPSSYIVVQLLGNVLLFMPLGFFLTYGGKHRFLKVFAVGAAVSVLVEAWQFLVGRSVDIDDVILNSLGAVVGAAIASALYRITRRFSGVKVA